jgi:hypothetical protein
MMMQPAGREATQREFTEPNIVGGFRRASLRATAGFFALALALGLMLAACASTYTRPLVSRGLPAEERKDYIIQTGFGIPENIKQAFLDGFVEVGMTREMVFQLYGAPDRTTGGDTNWEYVNNKGNLITGITFKGDKVEKVYGDPRGGSPATGNQAPS